MRKVAKFEKVSLEQFKNDWISTFGERSEQIVTEIYNNIKLPKRATITGIRCEMEYGWVLKCYPRSGLGFKYRMQLDNTVGIVDSDYQYSDNEGHIFLKVSNDTNDEKTITINRGDGIAQGIFIEYGITYDDEVYDIRNGGFGSTTGK